MLVSFTGAQSSGKTTLLNKAKVDSDFRNWNFVPEVTRVVKRKGLQINESGDNMTQLYILAEHLYNHSIKHDTVLDRCILDGLVYTLYLNYKGKVDHWVEQYARSLYDMLIDKIDIIFYTDPNIPLTDDGERSVNKQFKSDIVGIFNTMISKPEVRNKIVMLSGDVTTRFDKFKQTIKDFKS